MEFSADDPKWTAYVLGELSPEGQAEVEREMAESPDARREVAEIRSAVAAIASELKAGASPGLTAQQRAAIVSIPAAAAASPNSVVLAPPRPKRSRILLYAAATAAALLIGVTLLWPPIQRARESVAHLPEENRPGQVPLSNHHDSALNVPKDVSGVDGKWTLVTPRIIVQEEEEEKLEHFDVDGEFAAESHDTPFSLDEVKKESGDGEQAERYAESGGGVSGGPVASQGGGGRFGPGDDHGFLIDPWAVPRGGVERSAKPADGARGAGVTASSGPSSQGSGEKGGAGNGFSGKAGASSNYSGTNRLADNSGARLAPIPQRQSRFSPDDGPANLPPELRANVGPVPAKRRLDRAEQFGVDAYDHFIENAFLPARENPLSTFSIDVDTASYSIMRRYLTVEHRLPPKAAVRIEEMINYFHYDYPQPEGDVPFSANVEVAGCPWNPAHRLVRVGLKGKEMAVNERPASNLVFLIDVSGSMSAENRLPLVKRSMKLLLEQLRENDRVAIVVYAGEAGLVLPSTSAVDREPIIEAIDRLQASGSTNGGEGIQLAYATALKNFVKGGTNRVILATDGDFNVGVTDRTELVALVTAKAKQGVAITALGFGMGNLRDNMLVQLADKGNGNYAYIDDFQEARKVFVEQLAGTLVTIAKDVKIQIEFNPAQVESYRLIGYEKRALRNEDFNDDRKDAGEIGAGHAVTALYELVPPGADEHRPEVDPLKYQRRGAKPVDDRQDAAKPADSAPRNVPAAVADELLTLKLRYKQPEGDTSKLIEVVARDGGRRYAQASADFKFAAAVAQFGMILRDSKFKGDATLNGVAELAQEGLGRDVGNHRAEFLKLVEAAKECRR